MFSVKQPPIESRRLAGGARVHPGCSWRFQIESVVLMEWEQGEMLLTRWDPASGLRPPERRRLDPSAGLYTLVGA
jgi:hypothetical protein